MGYEKMRELNEVLFLMPKLPYPPYEDGGVLIYYYLTKYLRDINIIYFKEHKETTNRETQIFPNYTSSHRTTHIEVNKSLLVNKASFINGYDIEMNLYYSEDGLKYLLQYIKENQIKTILCNISLLRYAEKIKELTSCKIYLHSIDAKSMVEYSKLKKSNINEKAKSLLKYFIYKNLEKKFNIFEGIVVVSDLDKKYLVNNTGISKEKIVTISNGVDTDNYEFTKKEENECNRRLKIGFSGIMNYYPNQEAVVSFLEDVYPELLKEYPSIEYWIIGRNPTKEIINIANNFDDNVIVTGFVNDIKEYLSKLDIYVSPLNSGGGIKNKILEAMALGLPIIASETSMAGIAYTDEVLIYTDKNDLIKKIKYLICNPKIRTQLSQKGKQLVLEKYSWKKQADRYFNLLKS
jgi:glycosyltransferase involved in cell wall biosynthesis